MRTVAIATLASTLLSACATTNPTGAPPKAPGVASDVPGATAGPAEVKIGRCTGIAGLEETKAAGFDYAELGVAAIAKLSDAEMEEAAAKHKAVGLPTPAANGFLPGEVRVTGPDADPDKQLQYVRKAFDRMVRLGVKVIVFGSAPARNVPDGFPREQAWKQLVEFGKRIAPEA